MFSETTIRKIMWRNLISRRLGILWHIVAIVEYCACCFILWHIVAYCGYCGILCLLFHIVAYCGILWIFTDNYDRRYYFRTQISSIPTHEKNSFMFWWDLCSCSNMFRDLIDFNNKYDIFILTKNFIINNWQMQLFFEKQWRTVLHRIPVIF